MVLSTATSGSRQQTQKTVDQQRQQNPATMAQGKYALAQQGRQVQQGPVNTIGAASIAQQRQRPTGSGAPVQGVPLASGRAPPMGAGGAKAMPAASPAPVGRARPGPGIGGGVRGDPGNGLNPISPAVTNRTGEVRDRAFAMSDSQYQNGYKPAGLSAGNVAVVNPPQWGAGGAGGTRPSGGYDPRTSGTRQFEDAVRGGRNGMIPDSAHVDMIGGSYAKGGPRSIAEQTRGVNHGIGDGTRTRIPAGATGERQQWRSNYIAPDRDENREDPILPQVDLDGDGYDDATGAFIARDGKDVGERGQGNVYVPGRGTDGNRGVVPEVPPPPAFTQSPEAMSDWLATNGNSIGNLLGDVAVAPAAGFAKGMNDATDEQLDNYYDNFDQLDGIKSWADGMMDPGKQAEAEAAARDSLRHGVTSERDAALRMSEAKANRGGVIGTGSQQGIHNAAMQQMAEGERGLKQDAFGRQLAAGQAGAAARAGAAGLQYGLMEDQFTSPKEIMAAYMEAFPELMDAFMLGGPFPGG